jgi:predicted transposase YbfD/YdcC
MANNYIEKIRDIIPKAQRALRASSRCFGQGNVRYHANQTWGDNWADECVRNADESALELNWVDPDQIASEIEKARQEGREAAIREAAAIASRFSVKKDRELIPDFPWEDMSEPVRIAAHTTAQQISAEIQHMLEKK